MCIIFGKMNPMKSKKIKNNWVTMTEFKKAEKSNKSDHNYLNYKIDTLANELKEFKNEFIEFRNYVTKTLDWLVGAFKKFDEEHTVFSEKSMKITAKLDNHESRIQTLEKKSTYS